MNPSDFVVSVNESDFEYEVLSYSQNVPVVVDFWAEWCVPCKTLGPILERLAQEGRGAFRLAKVNVDENPNLAIRYSVRSIPNVKAFVNGQIAAEFSGAQPEARVREFIHGLAPSPFDLALEKGGSLLGLHQWQSAEQTFRQVLEQAPENSTALLGLAKSLLVQGYIPEAQQILRGFPASREYGAAQVLRPLAETVILLEQGKLDGGDPLDPAFANAVRLASRGKVHVALDGLLDVIRQNRRYRAELPRQLVLALLEILGEADPETRQYRSELASILF